MRGGARRVRWGTASPPQPGLYLAAGHTRRRRATSQAARDERASAAGIAAEARTRVAVGGGVSTLASAPTPGRGRRERCRATAGDGTWAAAPTRGGRRDRGRAVASSTLRSRIGRLGSRAGPRGGGAAVAALAPGRSGRGAFTRRAPPCRSQPLVTMDRVLSPPSARARASPALGGLWQLYVADNLFPLHILAQSLEAGAFLLALHRRHRFLPAAFATRECLV